MNKAHVDLNGKQSQHSWNQNTSVLPVWCHFLIAFSTWFCCIGCSSWVHLSVLLMTHHTCVAFHLYTLYVHVF